MNLINKIEELLKLKKQIILYGPPGTGKTFYSSNYEDSSKIKINKKIKSTSQFQLLCITDRDWNNLINNNFKLSINEANEDLVEDNIDNPIFIFVGGPHTQYSRIMGIADSISYNSINKNAFLENLYQIKGPHSTLINSYSNITDDLINVSANILKKIDKEIGLKILNDSNWGLTKETLTFHQSYSYEEFIEGLKPEVNPETNLINFKISEGFFKRKCREAFNQLMVSAGLLEIVWEKEGDIPELSVRNKKKALEHINDAPFFIIIDEINRGDISRIFGEIITLLEKDKRVCEENEIIVPLLYSRKKFGIPPNLYIIGTMNTTDRSIALLDIALRRRFGFIELMPDPTLIRKFKTEKNKEFSDIIEKSAILLEELNKWIVKEFSKDHQIGHSYFFRLKDAVNMEDAIKSLRIIWSNEITPLMQEYFYDNPKKLKLILGSSLYDEKKQEFINIDEMSDVHFIENLSKIKCN